MTEIIGMTAPAAGPAAGTPDDAAAAKLYDDQVTPSADAMYPVPVALESAFRGARETLADVGVPAADVHAREQAHATLVRDIGADPYALGALLYDVRTAADIAVARGEAEPSDEAILAAGEEARAAIRETYGAKDAEELLGRANRFVKSHAELHALMTTRGIGSQKAVVEAIVEHVRRVNFR